MLPQHSARTPEWYTPSAIIEPCRQLMGGIDLDPCSCPLANQTVRAAQIFTAADDGLVQPWRGRVFVNPPGGQLRSPEPTWGSKSIGVCWLRKAISEWKAGRVEQCCFLAFQPNHVALASKVVAAEGIPFVYPDQRIRYYCADGVGRQPPHHNMLLYLPPVEGRAAAVARFVELFSPIGGVFSAAA